MGSVFRGFFRKYLLAEENEYKVAKGGTQSEHKICLKSLFYRLSTINDLNCVFYS